ncbi:MAG: FAD-dependent oxidoreductase [Proteobacteria bacterium]|nr:FAD-dependent oxidoreductase [Pseudomonadota bacterium]
MEKQRPSGSSDYEYDAVFLGGGGAGNVGGTYLRIHGGKALIVDSDDHLGGKCPKNACYIHHLLYDCAVELDFSRQFAGKLWWPKFDKRVAILPIINLFKAKREKTYKNIQLNAKARGVDYILKQKAEIITPQLVQVGKRKIRTKAVVVATGARPNIPSIPGIHLKGVLSHASFIEELDYEPERVLVVGASKIGAPYASFFNACGCETTIVDQVPFFRILDHEVRQYVIREMTDRGLNLFQETEVVEIFGKARVESVHLRKNNKDWIINVDTVFMATGMIPNSEIVQHLGVNLGPNSEIKVNNRMETNVPHVYAAGDVIGFPMEQWKARKTSIIASKNILGLEAEFAMGLIPDQLHTTYEVCWVGLTEKQAKERFKHTRILKMGAIDLEKPGITPMAERMMLMGHLYPEKTGFQKLIYDAGSGKVLGLHHVGYGAKDSFTYLAYLIERGLTVDQLSEMTELFMDSGRFIQMARLAVPEKKMLDE